ncbi:MAG: glycosyltransferase family 2 protein [Bacteroidia bacterium]|nr:glycosyltransferase family 2 protein [Bacteroidia bacterium]
MEPAVTILILNWNGKSFLEKFLPSVLATDYSNFQVLLADNGSTDDSVALVSSAFPKVKVLELGQNWGFTTGNNKALEQIDTPYFVLLNSDVEVDSGWLRPLVEMAETDPNIASIQPKIRQYNRKTAFEYAGAAGGWIDRFGYPFCQGRIFEDFEEDEGQYDRPAEIFWATGACCLVRKSVTDRIGLFEDRFFAHWEEIDFCWRARNYGYKIMYCPSSVVYHVGGGTLKKENPRKTFLNAHNSLATLLMNYPMPQALIKVYIRLVLDGVWAAKALTAGEFKTILAILKSHWSFFFEIPFWLKRRRQKYRDLKNFTVNKTAVYQGSIVWKHFGRGLKKFSELGL